METFVILAGIFVTAGTVFAAIFAARGGAEKTLKEHIDRLESEIKVLKSDLVKLGEEKEREIKELRGENQELRNLYQQEKERNDVLEKNFALLTKKRKKKG